jgi:uncharacterized zinc-type alcohol dehydrogenase-like protein
MQKHAGGFNFILDAVSARSRHNAYLNVLAGNVTLVSGQRSPSLSLP